MKFLVKYSDEGFKNRVRDLIELGEPFQVLVDNKRVAKWLQWYLPYWLSKSGETSPFFKTAYCFWVIKNFMPIIAASYHGAGVGYEAEPELCITVVPSSKSHQSK